MGHAGGHRSRHSAHDRRRQPHSFPWRVAHRHRARESVEEPGTAREHGAVAAAAQRVAAHHDRRRRHRILGHEARRARIGPAACRARAEDDRQRSRSAPAHRHVRLPDRASLRRRDREEPDGRREDDVALVHRDCDGAHRRSPEPRHRQGRRSDAVADSRRVLRAAAAQGARRHAGRRHHQADELWQARWRGGHRRRGRAAHQRGRSRRAEGRRARRSTVTCASQR